MDRIAILPKSLPPIPRMPSPVTRLPWNIPKPETIERALAEFKTLIEKNPDYIPGYFMAAQTLASAERTDEAKRMLVDGIASARRTGKPTPSPR